MIYLKLFLVFAKIGLFGFGGGLAMLPMIYQGARDFQLMSGDEFSNLVAISQVTPGPLAVNAATYVGYYSAGLPGALVATFGEALPSFILVLITCYFINKYRESKAVEGAFAGIRPVTVGLLASAVVFMGQSAFANLAPVPVIICAASIVLIGKFKLNPIFIVIGSGVIGAFLCG